jgi:fatty acid desaturase
MSRTAVKPTDVLTPEEIRAFTRASDLAGIRAVAVSWAIIAAALAAVARWPHPVTFVLAVIVLGGRQLSLAVLMHEAAHGTLFRTRVLNETLAQWLCAWPVWTDVARYRKHHIGHHAHAGTDRDPDLSLVTPFPTTSASLARKFARDLSGVSGLKRVVGLLAVDLELLEYTVSAETKRLPWRGAWHHARAFARNATGFLVTNAALAGALVAAGHGWVYLAWVAAFLTTFGAILRVRSIAEHACMERTADPLRNTRTTHAGWIARLLVAPNHVNYHVEHHLLMTVPYFRLPALHRLLVERGALPEASVEPSYLAVLRRASQP